MVYVIMLMNKFSYAHLFAGKTSCSSIRLVDSKHVDIFLEQAEISRTKNDAVQFCVVWHDKIKLRIHGKIRNKPADYCYCRARNHSYVLFLHGFDLHVRVVPYSIV